MNKICFVTGNKNKLIEIQQLVTSYDIISLPDLNFYDDIPETEDTIEGNALLKSNFINALIINLPEKILYISCEPSSLARDLKQLKKYYIISKVLPVDMFSQTYHVETITLLIRK